MPNREWNYSFWNNVYDWPEAGEEWSEPWGGSDMQWFSTLLPRLHCFLPARNLLEIAPGFGRWTNYLLDHAEKLILVDMSEKCLERCQARFSAQGHRIAYFYNDGFSLEFLPDNSIDFVFSFDSLVHAEYDVIDSYLSQLSKKMTADAVGFIHHSNIGMYEANTAPNPHSRALTMSHQAFASLCDKYGLKCTSQELIYWRQDSFNDGFSVFTPASSRWVRPNIVLQNARFMADASYIQVTSKLYGRDRYRPQSPG
jgi:Methyltransferase domain